MTWWRGSWSEWLPLQSDMKQSASAPHRSLAEGEAHLKKTPYAAVADWKPKLRKREPGELLAASVKGRVRKLLGLKTERMAASPFGFFRGAAPVMAYDLSLGARTGLVTQLCGDAHVENLGAYDTPDGRLVFDINDFDESMPGPFEWDVKRMATSLMLASSQAHLHEKPLHHAAAVCLEAYCGLMAELARLPVLEVARFQVHRLRAERPISKLLGEAERSTPVHVRDHLTKRSKGGDGSRSFRSEPPLLTRVTGPERGEVLGSLKAYRECLLPERRHFFDQFRALDVAFKVVGTGSVGLRDYVVYLEGNGPDDPLFLQVKQEVASCYAPYLKQKTPANEGRRACEAQRAMQLQSDPMLGWTRFGKRDYLVRQLNDHKATLDVTLLDEAALLDYAHVAGEMLARGHARAGNARVLAGYLGHGKQFTSAILDFATAYAGQTMADWKVLVATGRKL